MKAKHAIALLIAGYCLEFVGNYFKIVHRPGADLAFLVALVLKVLGALVLLYKIIRYPKFRDFMNK